MKTFITALATFAATAVVYNVNAQSLEQGKKLLVYEKYASAEAMLKPLAASGPEANYYYGLSLLKLNKVAEAKAVFAKFPDDYMNQSGAAQVLFAEGKNDEANKVLEDIVDHAKKRDWEKLQFAADAITYSDNAKNLDQAIGWYTLARDRSKDNEYVLLGLADALLRKNTGPSNGDAVGVLDKIAASGNLASLAHARQGHLWMRATNYKDALASYNKAKEADPQNPLPYEDLANAYYKSGTYDLAKKNIEEYLKYSDKSSSDQMRYGNILYLTKDYTGAEKIYQQLINDGAGKQYPSLYRGLAFAQYQNNDLTNALTNLNTYRSKMTDQSKLTYEDYLYTGMINAVMSKDDTANAAQLVKTADENFDKAIALNKDEIKTNLYHQITDSYKEAKNWGEVSLWYTKLVKADTNAAPIDYFNAGYYAYFAKDFAAATAGLNAFNKRYPEENLGYFWLGRTKAAQDSDTKSGAAIDDFKNWLARPEKEGEPRKKDDLVYAYQYLAMAYYNKGNSQESINYANKLNSVDPGNTTADQIIKYFKAKGTK